MAADKRITDLAALTGANIAKADKFVLVDVSDMSMAATGTDKSITAGEMSLAMAGVYNVKAYGALGNGSTDDTTAIQAAIDAAAAATYGGIVFLPPGNYVTQTLTMKTLVWVRGSGAEITTLKQKASNNDSVFKGANFATLTGRDTNGGISDFAISDLSIDGNKANNTTGYGIRVYGYHYRLENVRIRNCDNDGIYSEWYSGAGAIGNNDMMATVSNVFTHGCTNNGVTWKGPHDSRFTNCESFLNGNCGFAAQLVGTACEFTNCHTYGLDMVWGFYLETTGNLMVGCEAEGAGTNATTGGQVFIGANDNTITGGHIFGAGAHSGNVRGIVIGDGSHTAVAGSAIDTKVSSCLSGAIDFTQDGGSKVSVSVYQATGALYVGTPHANTELQVTRLAGAGTFPVGTGNIFQSLGIRTGANCTIGTGTLTAGKAQVYTAAITNNSAVFLTYITPAGTLGVLAAKNPGGTDRSAGNWFFVSSLTTTGAVQTGDTSTFYWWLVEAI